LLSDISFCFLPEDAFECVLKAVEQILYILKFPDPVVKEPVIPPYVEQQYHALELIKELPKTYMSAD